MGDCTFHFAIRGSTTAILAVMHIAETAAAAIIATVACPMNVSGRILAKCGSMGCDPCCSRPIFVPHKILFPPPYPTPGVGGGSYMLRVDKIERGGGGSGRKRRTQGRGSG